MSVWPPWPVPRRALAGVALAISLVLAACGDDEAADDPNPEQTTSPTEASGAARPPTAAAPEPDIATITVALSGGEVVGEVRTEVVALDQAVRLEVTGDTDEEVHVHTYDLFGDVSPNKPAVIELVADVPGVHEVELEGSHRLILELQVEP